MYELTRNDRKFPATATGINIGKKNCFTTSPAKEDKFRMCVWQYDLHNAGIAHCAPHFIPGLGSTYVYKCTRLWIEKLN